MNRRNSTTALFAIVAIACLANATQTICDRFTQYLHREVGEVCFGGTLHIATFRHWRPNDSNTLQVLYRFGTRSLAINCSSAHCLVVLSNTGEA